MDIAHTNAVERIARVLAAQRLSANADGADASASHSVDEMWPNLVDDAVAVLKTLREPDAAMAEAGDAAVWAAMIGAALGRRNEADGYGSDDRMTLLALLDGAGEGLRLTLRCLGGQPLSGAPLPFAQLVADLAEANREIDVVLHAHPGHEVVRAGDGWVTHPE